MRMVFAPVLVFGLAVQLHASAPPTPEQAVQAKIDTLIDALKTKDFDKAMADWPADAPFRATFRSYLPGILPPPGFTGKFEEVTLSRWNVGDKEVTVRLRIVAHVTAIKGTDNYRSTMVFNARFARTADGVQWIEMTHGATDAAAAIRKAATREEALRILKDNADIPPRHLCVRLLKQTIAAIDAQELAAAKQLRDATAELTRIDPLKAGPYADYTAGLVARFEGRPELAVAVFTRAVKGFSALGDVEEELSVRYRLLDAVLVAGDFKQLEKEGAAAVALARKINRPAAVALALSNYGFALQTVGRYADAEEKLWAALKIQREHNLIEDSAGTLLKLGAVERLLGNHAAATESLNAALKIIEKTGDEIDRGYALMNFAAIAHDEGRYDDALTYCDKARAVFAKLRYRYGLMAANTTTAMVKLDRGAYEEALAIFHETHKEAVAIGNLPAKGVALLNIGECERRAGRHMEALNAFRTVAEGAVEHGDKRLEAKVQQSLSSVHSALGELGRVHFHSLRSLQLAREIGDPKLEAEALIGLANAKREGWGKLEDAREMYRDALTLATKSNLLSLEIAATVNLALLEQTDGKHDGAVRALQNLFGKVIQSKNPSLEGTLRISLGQVLLRAGRLEEAEVEFKKAEAQLGETIRDEQSYAIRLGHGHLAVGRKDWKSGIPHFEAAIGITERMRRNIRGPESRIGQFTDGNVESYLGLAQCLTELGESTKAFEILERSKARTLSEILQEGRVVLSHRLAPEERAHEAEFLRAVTERMNALAAAETSKRGPQDVAEARRLLHAAQDRLLNYRRLLYAAHPELEAQRAEFAPVDLKELGASVFRDHPGLVVLSYLLTRERLFVFVLTSGDNPGDPAKLSVHPVSVNKQRLQTAVNEYVDGCAKPGLVPTSPDLVRWLLTPAAKELKAAKEVVIVPQGFLHQLPFHALRGNNEPYPIERFSVSYAPSATALVKMTELADRRRKERERDGGVLAVGISDFGKREKPLAEAEKEAKAVEDRFKVTATATVVTLLGSQATKAKIQAAWSSCRYLHFATHGEFNPAYPMFSSLLVTPGGKDEGRLYARDVLETELKAELAVLSACKTGVGRVTPGEGLLGMSWAWFAAGVPSLVVSQWSVDDASTAKLMAAFYTKLLAGATKAESLREAQLALLKVEDTSHPYYWAPFVVLGDARK